MRHAPGKILQSKRSDGTSMVEFAVVLPLISILIFGIVQYGIIFNARVTLKDIAAVAARYATLGSGASSDDVKLYAEGLVSDAMELDYLDDPVVDEPNINGVLGAKRVTLTYRLPTYFPVPGTDANGRFVIRADATMR